MPLPAHLDRLNADELRGLLIESQARIDKLTYELAYYKRQRYGVKTERLSPEQAQLLEETADADLAAMSEESNRGCRCPQPREKGQAKRRLAAGRTTAHRDLSRTGIDDLCLWLPDEAHR